MILLCGIPSETPMVMVREQLESLGASYVVLNQREFAHSEVFFQITRGELTGCLKIEGKAYPLENFRAVYTRLMDDRFLPELEHEPPDSELRRYCRGFHE